MAKAKASTTTLYSANTQPNGWITIAKFSDGDLPESVYHLEPLSDGTYACECPGFAHHGYCRHRTMLELFRHAGRLNTGALYDFNSGEFIQSPFSDVAEA